MSGRIRTLKPEWLEDEPLVECSDTARVLSAGLLLVADDHGNGRGSAKFLGSRIWPGRGLDDVLAALAELVKIRFVSLYEVDNQEYFSIRNWSKHQRIDNAGKRRVPAPPDGLAESRGISPRAPRPVAAAPGGEHPDQSRPDLDLIPHTTTSKEELYEPHEISLSDPDLLLAEQPKMLAPLARKRAAPTAAASSSVNQVRDKFCACYAELYNGAAYDWDYARDGKQAKLLARDDEQRTIAILAEIDSYFGWKDPEVIRKGHTFSHGFHSFVQVRRRLHADMAAPERHEAAAIISQERYEAGKQAFKQKQEQQWQAEHSATSQAAINSPALAALPSRRSAGS